LAKRQRQPHISAVINIVNQQIQEEVRVKEKPRRAETEASEVLIDQPVDEQILALIQKHQTDRTAQPISQPGEIVIEDSMQS
jgi:hypothetical protein